MTRVAILWHMHQPYYEDLVTREHILPWVRLHALKDYYGMVALLEEFPEIRVTFNLVPSLLVQLEAFASEQAHDRYLELGLKPAADLTEEDAAFILQNFFHAQRHKMIEIYPRYGELLARRGPIRSPSDARAAVRRFSEEDLRDLQVWQKLAWVDPFYLEGDDRVRDLLARGRTFKEEDKATLRAVELDLLNAVIPAYRQAASRGQVELSASPFYHPILPLLCDTDIYRRTHPDSSVPRRRFMHPEDALEQLTRAVGCHERLFGRRPVGLWPSEGSVSDAMVPLVAEAGFRWMATDELILAETLGLTFAHDDHGQVDQPERLYVPYTVTRGQCDGRVRVPGSRAVGPDRVRVFRLGCRGGRRRLRRAAGGGRAALLAADRRERGPHPDHPGWRERVGALRRRRPAVPAGPLSAACRPIEELRTVTMAEACRQTGPGAGRHLPGVVDRRQLLHLDWTRRRPERLEPAGGCPDRLGRRHGGEVGRPRRTGRSPRAKRS